MKKGRICTLIFLTVFNDELMTFSSMVGNKIYFNLYTKTGKAISRNDFRTIEYGNDDLFFFIKSGLCKGFCYAICFDILKLLGKGKIEFVAVKEIQYVYQEPKENNYTLHVLYVNNGWAFDTYSVRQYPINEIYNLNKAIICKTFSYEDVKDVDYDEFWEKNYREVAEWCKRNNCTENWSDKEIYEREKVNR